MPDKQSLRLPLRVGRGTMSPAIYCAVCLAGVPPAKQTAQLEISDLRSGSLPAAHFARRRCRRVRSAFSR